MRYRYVVGGRERTGDRVCFGDGLGVSWRSSAERRAGRYPVGRKVSVFYDPEEPDVSVLEPGAQAVTYGGIAAGVVMTAFMAAWLYLGWG